MFHVPRAIEIAVRLEQDGYRAHDEVVRPGEGETQRALDVRLDALKADLRVHTNAKEAAFRLDGAVVGEGAGAFELKAIPPGRAPPAGRSEGLRSA